MQPIHYRDHRDETATGAPLILLHGAGGDLMHWPGALRRLPGRRVIALDLPGHGRSAGPPCPGIADYAAEVARFAAALGLGRAVLAGHSMGGAIALEIALRYPDRVAGLVLIATGARLPVSPRLLDAVARDFEQAAALLGAWAYGRQADRRLAETAAQRLGDTNPTLLLADLQACAAFDRTADIGRIAAPALVLCGEADTMTPPALGAKLAQRLPCASLEIIPGAGHMLMLELPGETARRIEAFLARTDAPTIGVDSLYSGSP
jgi:pimeloyl-ACP methyl ester carboxylesterase